MNKFVESVASVLEVESNERFLELRTVRDLYREVFLAFAAQVLKVDRTKLSGTTASSSNRSRLSYHRPRMKINSGSFSASLKTLRRVSRVLLVK